MTSAALPIPCVEGNRGDINIGIGATFLTICLVLTCLRIFTRTRLVAGGLGWDDGFIFIAMVLAVTLYACTVVHVKYGLGRHIGCLSPASLIEAGKAQAVGQVPVMMSSLASRISICLFLLRLFAVKTSWRWTLFFIIGMTAITNIACATAILLECNPRAKLWDPMLPGTCWSLRAKLAIGQFQGAISIFLDFVVSGLPIYYMWKIQLSWKIKTAICAIMSLGVFTACCALVRTVVLSDITGDDVTWSSALPSLMGDLEAYVAIIAANIATLRPLFTHKAWNKGKNVAYADEGIMRLNHAKSSNNSQGLDKWPNNSFDTPGSYNTKATAARGSDEEISMEHMEGIRKVTDVHVSV